MSKIIGRRSGCKQGGDWRAAALLALETPDASDGGEGDPRYRVKRGGGPDRMIGIDRQAARSPGAGRRRPPATRDRGRRPTAGWLPRPPGIWRIEPDRDRRLLRRHESRSGFPARQASRVGLERPTYMRIFFARVIFGYRIDSTWQGAEGAFH